VGDLIELGPDGTSTIEHGRRRSSSFGLLFRDSHSAAASPPSYALATAPSVPVGAAPSAPLCAVVWDVALLGHVFALVRNYLQSRMVYLPHKNGELYMSLTTIKCAF
jgi:hypothetical protein